MSSDGDERHKLFLEFHDETVRRAIEPEAETEADDRSDTTLVEDGVVVRSSDLRSLRAAVNGWRRLVSVAEETERVVR